jgi:hypothetical protein
MKLAESIKVLIYIYWLASAETRKLFILETYLESFLKQEILQALLLKQL